MSVAEAEGKLNVPKDTKAISNQAIVLNFIFSIIVISLIIQTFKVNILSSYTTDFDGEYFHCRWDSFDMCWKDTMDDTYNSWDAKQCEPSDLNYDVTCEWYTYNSTWEKQCGGDCVLRNNPLKSGKVWYNFNIIALVSLTISIIGYIVIAATRKYPKLKAKYPSIQPQKGLFVLFQSFIPTISLLTAIVYWFRTNGNDYGCWTPTYTLVLYGKYDIYTEKQIGESMILDIVAAVLVGIHLIVYINHYFNNKKKRNRKRNRKIKHGEPILFKDNYGDEGNAEHGGIEMEMIEYDIEKVTHVRIESIATFAPGNDEMEEIDIRINEYDSVKQWFFESVAIPQDYKEIYYNKLIQNGFDNFVVIKYIDNQDLMDIGVNKLGHRKTILIATQKL
eukprot:134695_1